MRVTNELPKKTVKNSLLYSVYIYSTPNKLFFLSSQSFLRILLYCTLVLYRYNI